MAAQIQPSPWTAASLDGWQAFTKAVGVRACHAARTGATLRGPRKFKTIMTDPKQSDTSTGVTGASKDELEKLELLRKVPMESVRGLLEFCPLITLATGQTLLTAGQNNQTMYLILAGRLSVHLDALEAEPVAMLDAGQTVGEMSVIDDRPVSAFVVAAEPTRLLAVSEETFWRLVTSSHQLALNLLFALAQRMRANNSTLSESVRRRAMAERDATVDGLTGLSNRRWLDETLPRLLKRHQHASQPLSLMMVDVDHFKKWNDRFGHLVGDRTLVAVAKTLLACLRPTDLAARYGGEEMVVLLPDTPLSGARVAAERLRTAIGRLSIQTDDGSPTGQLSVSIGVAESRPGDSSEGLIGRADSALYSAKELGRDRVEVAT